MITLFKVLNFNLWPVSPKIKSTFSEEYTIKVIYGRSPFCSSIRTANRCYPAQVVNSFELSDVDRVHTGEPLPYQYELEPSPEGDNIPVDVPNEARIRRFDRMNKAGIVDCAFIVIVCRKSVLLDIFTYLYCLLLEVRH